MTISPWPETQVPVVENLQEQLRASQENELLLTESIADLQLALEDVGWTKLAAGVQQEFTEQGRRQIRALCRTMAISNPLIKRGLTIRIGYVWGQGVEVTATVGEDELLTGQVNGLIDDFEADNTHSLTGSQACEELERAQGTDGEVFLALFTSPLTGRVQVRSTPTDEIVDIICNPEDRDEPWFYVREYAKPTFDRAPGIPDSTFTRSTVVRVVHPALGYRPAARVRFLNGHEVRWDAPILHVPVNRLDGWKHGIPDAYASIAWARMYRDFLVDWAGLTKSLSKIAWKATGDTKSRAQRAAAAAQEVTVHSPTRTGDAGQQVTMGPGHTFEAVSKSGATIDANSGKPLAGMAAAGLGVSLISLLTDAAVSGARATEETLDKPTILEMGMRRLLWQNARTRILEHVIAAAVEAPKGRLKGTTLVDDWGRKHTALAGGVEPALDFTWPPLADMDPVKIIAAIVSADSTDKMPPITTVKLMLSVLGVKDVDQVLRDEGLVDEEGQWVGPASTVGQVAVDRFRDGQDPIGGDEA